MRRSRQFSLESLERRTMFSGTAVGSCLEAAAAMAAPASGATATVDSDPAVPPPDTTVQTVRVLVLNYEPTVPSEDNRTLWQIFGWQDPRQLAAGYISDLEAATDGGVDYQVVEWRDLNEFPIFTDGTRYNADQYVQNRRTNTGWSSA